jgi:hypothetical protein
MTQGTDLTPLTHTEVERLIAAVQEINGTIQSFADRVVQMMANPPAASD